MERVRGESANDRNDRAIRVASHWYSAHLANQVNDLRVILLTNDRDNKKQALQNHGSQLSVYTGRFDNLSLFHHTESSVVTFRNTIERMYWPSLDFYFSHLFCPF